MDKGNTPINKNKGGKNFQRSMLKPWKNPLELTKVSKSENAGCNRECRNTMFLFHS